MFAATRQVGRDRVVGVARNSMGRYGLLAPTALMEDSVNNIAEVVWRRAAEAPDRVGLIDEAGQTWSYAAIANAGAVMAARLSRAVSSAEPDKRKALLFLQNSPIMVFALLGLWHARIAAVPVNVMYKESELRRSILTTKPALVVTTRDHESVVHNAGYSGEILLVDEFTRASLENPTSFDPPGDLEQVDAIVLFTGGSTGPPKAVTVTHEGFGTSLDGLVAASKGGRRGPFPIASDDVAPNLLYFPLFHAGGINALLFAWTVGRRVVLMERFRADRVVELAEKYQVDNLFLLPTMMFDLLQLPSVGDALSSVRAVLASGGEVSLTLRKRFEERFRIPIQSNYGSTEVGHVAGWTMRDVREGRWAPGSVGMVYDGVELEIRDDVGNPVGNGEIGELWVKTEVTRGYVSEHGVDAGSLRQEGWVRTQDVGYLDAEGRLFLVGRARDMIKCGGFQVWPSEVEESILSDPLVKDVAVISGKDERLGEIPVAFVVVDEALDEDTLTERIVSGCRSRLAHYKMPRRVFRVGAIPRSEAGKTDKTKLTALIPGSGASGDFFGAELPG